MHKSGNFILDIYRISHLSELGYVNLEIVRNENKEIIKRKIKFLQNLI